MWSRRKKTQWRDALYKVCSQLMQKPYQLIRKATIYVNDKCSDYFTTPCARVLTNRCCCPLRMDCADCRRWSCKCPSWRLESCCVHCGDDVAAFRSDCHTSQSWNESHADLWPKCCESVCRIGARLADFLSTLCKGKKQSVVWHLNKNDEMTYGSVYSLLT